MKTSSPLRSGRGLILLLTLVAITPASCRDQPPEVVPQGGGSSPPSSPEAVTAGMNLYMENGCGVCHGRDGSGSGPLAHTIEPPPRDYRDPASYKQGTSVAEIAYTIATGVGGATSKMPQYPHLSEEERALIAQYIVSLQDR